MSGHKIQELLGIKRATYLAQAAEQFYGSRDRAQGALDDYFHIQGSLLVHPVRHSEARIAEWFAQQEKIHTERVMKKMPCNSNQLRIALYQLFYQ